MTQLRVNLQEYSYPILIRSNYDGLCECLDQFSSSSKMIIICDINVDYYQSEELISILKAHGYTVYKYVFEAGEGSKNLDTVNCIYHFLLEINADRNDAVIALGGGVAGDIAGFVAATYLRGISFVQIPTSLLAQVDSSVGGKVGVNFNDLKNVIGAFYQPKLVFINTNTLKTLPIREKRAGLAEVIVHCIIGDSRLFEYIKKNLNEIFDHNDTVLKHIISKNCAIKIKIVERDEHDRGLRAILNFGHTIGHAIESACNYQYLHGECVAIGIIGAFKLASYLKIIEKEAEYEVRDVLEKIGLPCRIENLDLEKVYNKMLFDKKFIKNELLFILPQKIGKVMKYKINDKGLIKKVLKELT